MFPAQSRKLRKKYELFECRKHGDQFWDIVYENAVLFMQQCTVYLDLADSIKAGDSRRTLFNLDLQLCMFHAGRQNKYAAELYRLRLEMELCWTDFMWSVVKNNLFVTLTGKEG